MYHSCQVFVIRSSRVFGVKLHVVHELASVLHRIHRPLDNLFTVGVELVLDMKVGGTDPRVDTFPFSILERLGGHLDIFLHRAGEGTDGGPRDRFRNFYYRLEVARARNREAGLYHVHP